MMEEPFATGSTLFHRRDTRVKLIGAAAISLVLGLTSSFATAATGCLVTSFLLILSKPDPHLVLKRIASVNIFTLFLLITLPLTYGGDEMVHSKLQFLHFSLDGLRMACLIALKTNGILFCFLALLATSTTVSLGHGLGKLGMPRKLIFLLLFSYRQLFVIHQEYQRLQRAAKLRGFSPANSLHTYRTYSYLFGMTLVKSWNRAERVHQAMVLRGFSGRLIPLNQPQPSKADYCFLIVLLLISLILAGLSLVPLPL
jgi:cobalt/nickel transport system permease protein